MVRMIWTNTLKTFMDPADMTFDFKENLDINVKEEHSSDTNTLDLQEDLKTKDVNKQKKANNKNEGKPLLGNMTIKSETNEEDQIANDEAKNLRKKEKHRLKMQRQRKRQLESGDIVLIREKEKLKRRR